MYSMCKYKYKHLTSKIQNTGLIDRLSDKDGCYNYKVFIFLTMLKVCL